MTATLRTDRLEAFNDGVFAIAITLLVLEISVPPATGTNLFKPGSTWEIHAAPTDGGSLVDVIAVCHLRGFKGRLLTPVFPLGLAKSTVAAHLRHFLSKVEVIEGGK